MPRTPSRQQTPPPMGTPVPTPPPPSAATCRHCGRPESRHGKMVKTCWVGGKAGRTRF